MSIKGNNRAGFTMGEVAISFIIIAIITAVTLTISTSRIEYAQKQVAKATLNNLKVGVGNLVAEGYTDESGNLLKQLNPYGHVADNSGFCDRLASILNTVPIDVGGSLVASNCSAPAVSDSGPFDSSHVNFQTANGAKYYNFGPDATSGIYTVYVDISTGKNQGQSNTTQVNLNALLSTISLNGSVIKFYIQTDGTVTSIHP